MSDLQMRALCHTSTEEGELFPGDLFYPGFFHVRETGVFDTSKVIGWTTPKVRAHQLITEGLAEHLEEVVEEKPKKSRKKVEVVAELLEVEKATMEALEENGHASAPDGNELAVIPNKPEAVQE